MDTIVPKWLPWSYALRGVLGILLGILMLVFPVAGLATFILFFGAFAIADGLLALTASFAGRGGRGFDWMMLLYGFLSIIVGALFLILPALSLTMFVVVVAAWMLVLGVATLVSTISWRKALPHPWVPIFWRSCRSCSDCTCSCFRSPASPRSRSRWASMRCCGVP